MEPTPSEPPPAIPNCLEHYGSYVKGRLFADSRLHPEQQDALLKIVDWFGSEETKKWTSVIVMPTGTGKSGVICCLPYVLGWAKTNKKIDHDFSKPMLVIAPGKMILCQLEEDLCYDNLESDRKPFLLDKQLVPDDFNGYYRTLVVKSTTEIKRLGRTEDRFQLVLSNAQKWKNDQEEEVPNYQSLKNDLFSAVIVDEAHHLPSDQWQNIIKKFSPAAKVIFFTATPYRGDSREITEWRNPGQREFTYNLSIDEALQQKLIRAVQLMPRAQNKSEVLRNIKAHLETKNENLLPGKIKHGAIVITKNIDEAKEMEKYCKDDLKWEHIKVIHSREKIKSQKKLLDTIKEQKFDLLIIVSMLLEGFNHERLSVAGILTNITSPVKFSQFIGRIRRLVRKPEEEKDVVAEIFTWQEEQETMFKNYMNPPVIETSTWQPDEL